MTVGPLIPHPGLINVGAGGPLTGPSAPTDDGAFADTMRGLTGDPQGAADQFNEGGFFANADAVDTPTLAIAAPSAATPAAATAASPITTPPLAAADLLAARDALPTMAAIEGRAAISVETTATRSAASPFVTASGKADRRGRGGAAHAPDRAATARRACRAGARRHRHARGRQRSAVADRGEGRRARRRRGRHRHRASA